MQEDKSAAGKGKVEARKVSKAWSSDFNLLEAPFHPFEAWFDLAGTRAARRGHAKK